ncbi:MAG: hypothetical protein IJG16_12880, partial [Clostridia bacterium]|nr:hypothetical protein [Clostridia bacterium]
MKKRLLSTFLALAMVFSVVHYVAYTTASAISETASADFDHGKTHTMSIDIDENGFVTDLNYVRGDSEIGADTVGMSTDGTTIILMQSSAVATEDEDDLSDWINVIDIETLIEESSDKEI